MYCWCHKQLLSNIVSYALRRSQWPWPDWAYAHTDPDHWCLMILAIDSSQYLAPPPPPKKKKSLGTCYMYYFIFCHQNKLSCILIGFYCLLKYLIISTFEVPSTICCKQFDPEAQTVCIDIKDDTSRYARCWRAHFLVLNLKTLVYTTFMGVSHALQYLNELHVLKVEDGKESWKIENADRVSRHSFALSKNEIF